MKKAIIALICIFTIAFCGCGMVKKSEAKDESSSVSQTSSEDNSISSMAAGNEEAMEMDSGDSTLNVLKDGRKIVKTAEMDLETDKFDKVVEALEDLTEKYEGYISSSSVNGVSVNNNYQELKNANYQIRVPSEKLDEFLDELSKLATVIRKSTDAEDITRQYYDDESRLNSLKIEQDRYLEILKKATEVKDIVEIENALTDVRAEIENLTTYLKKMDELTDLATIKVYIQEVNEETETKAVPKTIGERISSSFNNSLKEVKKISLDVFVFIISAIPYLGIIVIIYLIVINIYKAIRNNKKKSKK